jgi:hypothetical protein
MPLADNNLLLEAPPLEHVQIFNFLGAEVEFVGHSLLHRASFDHDCGPQRDAQRYLLLGGFGREAHAAHGAAGTGVRLQLAIVAFTS